MQEVSITGLILSWVPIFITVIAYALIAKRYSAAPKMLRLIEKQIEVLEQQKNAIVKIAESLEKRN